MARSEWRAGVPSRRPKPLPPDTMDSIATINTTPKEEERVAWDVLALLLANRYQLIAEMAVKTHQINKGAYADAAELDRLDERIAAMDFFRLEQREKVARMRQYRHRTGRTAIYHMTMYDREQADRQYRGLERKRDAVPCDIHVMLEVKHVKAVSWMAATVGEFYVSPDYTLFAFLAGVRAHDGIEPLVKPRGLPVGDQDERMSPDTEHAYGDWSDFAHDQGWLTPEEWIAACVSARMKSGESCIEALAIGNMAKALADSERYEAARLIFWFNS